MVFEASPVLDWLSDQEDLSPPPPPHCRPTEAPNAGNMSPFAMPLVPAEQNPRDPNRDVQFDLDWEGEGQKITQTRSNYSNTEYGPIPSLPQSFAEQVSITGGECLLGCAMRMRGIPFDGHASSAGMSSEIFSDRELGESF
eukprot:Hpha_TRINITY_DN13102_c0_g1::TRINITY_DN13102_c0_g1_i1::g.113476::m.113476